MKKRKKDQETINNKIKTKLILKGKRKKNLDAIKSPEKIIKQYRAQQKAYSHYKLKVNNYIYSEQIKYENSLQREKKQCKRSWQPITCHQNKRGLRYIQTTKNYFI